MPIINLQRRMAEQGRIRLGQKVTNSTGTTRPDKLDRFRFTSANRGLIEQIAGLYGGTPAAWDNDGKAEWEVVSDARSIPVIVVKGGFSQWYELWSKAGCLHRCDGEKDAAGAWCDPNDPQHVEATAKPTTRLSIMLSEIESLGIWRMESKGWNAAAELPSMAELAMHVGDLVPATLALAERSAVIATPKGPQTSRFVVPVLDLHVTKARLVELVGGAGGTPALGAPPAVTGRGPLAVEAPRPDYAQLVADATTVEELRAVWRQADEAGQLSASVRAWVTARAADLQPHDNTPPTTAPAPAPSDDGRVAAWMDLTVEAGKHGVTDTQLREMLEQEYAQPVEDITTDQLRASLQSLRDTTPTGP